MKVLGFATLEAFARSHRGASSLVFACWRLLETLPLHDEASLGRFFGAVLSRQAPDYLLTFPDRGFFLRLRIDFRAGICLIAEAGRPTADARRT
jgi:hypothetical protein